ncbi:hypothetical protein, partial [Salmonella sp. SAL4359]|uniref:hypothetical protein n=1 Tax=Salmonella sp. SAL4359 TaxID=3159880 RepID=UPI003978BF3E
SLSLPDDEEEAEVGGLQSARFVWTQPLVASQLSSVQASLSLQSPQALHSFSPAAAANVPGAQAVHEAASSVAELVPAAQGVQGVSVI